MIHGFIRRLGVSLFLFHQIIKPALMLVEMCTYISEKMLLVQSLHVRGGRRNFNIIGEPLHAGGLDMSFIIAYLKAHVKHNKVAI